MRNNKVEFNSRCKQFILLSVASCIPHNIADIFLTLKSFDLLIAKMILILIVFIATICGISADICDLCSCTKAECIVNYKIETSSLCARDFTEIYNCDGDNDMFKKSNQIIELDNIQWPNVNSTSVSVSFNNLKLTFLTK